MLFFCIYINFNAKNKGFMKKDEIIDYVKAIRKKRRKEELNLTKGFPVIEKISKSKKGYTRKEKHKESL